VLRLQLQSQQHATSVHETRRTFLLPRLRAWRRMEPILLGWVGEGGWAASLAERAVLVWELVEDSEAERLRPSSARMSSRETLRWGWVMGTSERFSTNLEAMVL
jgi:hypothetical protein